MGITPGEVGVTYEAEGMLFVTLEFFKHEEGWSMAKVMLLDDHPDYLSPIAPGTVMQIAVFSVMWEKATRFASPGEQGKVAP